ncbi:hypothetical protein V5799_024417, partial [Amblyomma americanum]
RNLHETSGPKIDEDNLSRGDERGASASCRQDTRSPTDPTPPVFVDVGSSEKLYGNGKFSGSAHKHIEATGLGSCFSRGLFRR